MADRAASRFTRRAGLAAVILAVAGAAAAEAEDEFPVRLVAAVDGDDDVTSALLVGASAELYRPVETGLWQRRGAGGVAVDVIGALRGPDGALFAIGRQTPLFRRRGQAWSASPLPNRGALRPGGPGGAPALAIGPHVYVVEAGQWKRLGRAADSITALWASAADRVYVATADGGLARMGGGPAATLRHSLGEGDHIVAFAGTPGRDLYALAASGTVLSVGARRAEAVAVERTLEGFTPEAMTPRKAGGAYLVGLTGGDEAVLAHADGGRLVATDEVPAPEAGDRFALLLTDRAGGVLLATERGKVRYRSKDGSWQEGEVLGTLPTSTDKSSASAAPARTR